MSRYSEREPGCLQLIGSLLGSSAAIIGLVIKCSADTSGTGNDFSFRGRVLEIPRDGDFRVEIITVKKADGKSAGIMIVGQQVKVYDNYYDNDCDNQVKGEIVEEQDGVLSVGEFVDVQGQTRDSVGKSKSNCQADIPEIQTRPVYDEAARVSG